jgi:hypothetical protein
LPLQRPDPRRPGEDATDTAGGLVYRERLLAGENENTRDVAEAIHWATVYADLFAYKNELCAVTENKVASMSLAARAEVERSDIKLFRSEAQRLDRRLQFWRRRSVDLVARAERSE